MAERRMISKVISISEKVNSLSLFGKLLYTWMIPHADDFGRLPGSPAKVRALVVPMGDETTKDVETAVADMHQKGLIQWYEIGGEKYIQITNFDDHQSGLHKRTKSKFPDPPTESDEQNQESDGIAQTIPGSSRNFLSELNRTRTEKNNTATTAHTHAYEPSNLSTSEAIVYETSGSGETISEIHKRVFGKAILNGLMQGFIADLFDKGCSEEFIKELMLETGETATAPSLRYMQATAERWLKEGITSRAEARQGNIASKARNGTRRLSAVPDIKPLEYHVEDDDPITKRLREVNQSHAGAAANGVP